MAATKQPKKIPSLVIKNSNEEKSSISPRNSKKGMNKNPNKPKKKNVSNKAHRFQKKSFSHPTWCAFANKFIWGLDKSGYECRVCSMKVSRKMISDAKKTVCGADSGEMVVETPSTAVANMSSPVFTIYLPHGAKKSVVLNPTEPLKNVLLKVCLARGIDIDEFVPEDINGQYIALDTLLGKIVGNEITFTKREGYVASVASPSKGKAERTDSTSNTDRTSSIDVKDRNEKSHKQEKVDRDEKNADKKKGGLLESIKTNKRKSQPQLIVDTKKNLTRSVASDGNIPPVQKRSIIEQYEFGQELGSGAFSVVKAATHIETKKVVAIKVLDKYEDDDEQTQKFKQEIAIISSLHHENIVHFYELDEDEDNFYVVMELVGGGELFDYIIENQTIPEKEAVCVIAQVLKAIEYMHSVGTAHRDLKPENLLYKTKDHDIIKIADFGESKSYKDGQLTTYCGTPDYMAPEIIKGDPYGSEVDVWAIGVITYVMLAGFPPFDGENDVEVFASILAIRYDYPSPEWDNISLDARDFISSIFVDDPKKRLTATQCLKHPWIVNNVPADLRVNKPTSAPASREKDNSRAVLDTTAEEPGELDLQNSPKDQVENLIEETMKLVNDSNLYMGELKTMMTIVEATSGKANNSLEKKVYETYWNRLHDLRNLLSTNTTHQKKRKK